MEQQKFQIIKKKPTGRLTTCRYCKYQFTIPEEQKQKWFELKNSCPVCFINYCNLKPTEKQLQELQSQYYENQKQKIYLEQIYKVLLPYCESLCLKFFRKSLMNSDDLQYYSHKATWKVVEQYISDSRRDDKEFKITDSFSSYIIFKLKESIFEKDERDCADESISQVKIEEDSDGNKVTFNTYDYSKECSKLKEIETEIINTDKNSEIEVYFNSIVENGEVKLLVAILNYIKTGEVESDLTFQYFGNEGKARFLYIIKKFKEKLTKGYFQ